MLTKEALQQIERRWSRADPGPWFSYVAEAGPGCIEPVNRALLQVLGGSREDLDFIAHAQDDIPRLILEVRRLTVALSALSAQTSSRSLREVSESRPFPITPPSGLLRLGADPP